MSFLRRIGGSMGMPQAPLRAPARPPVRERIRAFPEPVPQATVPDVMGPYPEPVQPRRVRRQFQDPGQQQFGPSYLTDMLNAQDMIQEGSRVGTDYVHVSELSDFCDRSYVLADSEGKLFGDRPTGGHRVMWKIGRAVERHVRDSIIKARDYKGILGRWVCDCGHTEVEGEHESVECAQCASRTDNYRELTLFDETAKVVGNIDLPLIVQDQDRILPVEIKSMNAKEWDGLTKPKPDHEFQVNCYRKLLHQSGYKLMPVNAIIVVTKDFKWGSPYKEFHTEPTSVIGGLVETAWGEATKLAQDRAANRLPPRRKCRDITDSRAKKCPVASSCFLRSSS